MKIILFVSFCLILGQVGCFDVIGYQGGSVIIYCNHEQPVKDTAFFCKGDQCMESDPDGDAWYLDDRVSVSSSPRGPKMIFRKLTVEDAGSYQCGETGVWNRTVNLKVKTDPCCTEPTTVTGYVGKRVTINCPYPEEFKRADRKRLYTENGRHGQYFTEVICIRDKQKDRFTISEDRRSNVVSVTFSDLTKEDEKVYYCSVWMGSKPVSYISHFREVQLQVDDAALNTEQ